MTYERTAIRLVRIDGATCTVVPTGLGFCLHVYDEILDATCGGCAAALRVERLATPRGGHRVHACAVCEPRCDAENPSHAFPTGRIGAESTPG